MITSHVADRESCDRNTLSSVVDDNSFGSPTATSSPKKTPRLPDRSNRVDLPMWILVLNCQSVRDGSKTESWLDSGIKSEEVFPDNFKHYRKDRSDGKRGGGVFILVADKYLSSMPEELKVEGAHELLWVKVKVKSVPDLYVGSFYRPPTAADSGYLEVLRQSLTRIPRSAHIWLGGDFNLPDMDWSTDSPQPSGSNITLCNQLITIASDFSLNQMVHEPTRTTETTSNILDLFFTNNHTLINKYDVISGIPDHEAVYVESILRAVRPKRPPRKVFMYSKADLENFRHDLKTFCSTYTKAISELSVDSCWELFKDTLLGVLEKHIPSKLMSGNKVHKPWITKEVKRKMRKRNKLFTKQKLKKSIGNAESDTQPNKQIRFWRFVNAMRKDSNGVSPLKDRGVLHSDVKDKADILNRQYESIFPREDT
ncbi:uncharacterized protein LOC134240394 [Saccostrea cucullata]|uniref:uncharacterized protein LOC134240394 n=1 Tax=Saccostrea cuccullata TaxID=36930 RepID=UPI002ED59B93